MLRLAQAKPASASAGRRVARQTAAAAAILINNIAVVLCGGAGLASALRIPAR